MYIKIHYCTDQGCVMFDKRKKTTVYHKWVNNVKMQQPIVKAFYMGMFCLTLKERNIKQFLQNCHSLKSPSTEYGGRRGRDRVVIGFTTTYVIDAYHHLCSEFESRSGRGVQHYVIKCVSDLQQVDGFLWLLKYCKKKKKCVKHHKTNQPTFDIMIMIF